MTLKIPIDPKKVNWSCDCGTYAFSSSSYSYLTPGEQQELKRLKEEARIAGYSPRWCPRG